MLQNSETERSLTIATILTYRLLKSETAVVLSVSREIPFKDPSEDSKHYHEASYIVDYRYDCANSVRAVEI